ncbi:hypothetical protein WJX81_003148 [Elliptochloris bilobata]|uniref:leucine--tRNA ligase n=1 Tax=Elliptochloris bilobata TaxID=381761 RepID=A0AAW1R017_9CHLO
MANKEEGPQNFARRDLLLSIQAESQKRWTDERVFEVDAPAAGGDCGGKFFGNFPYPYMNGLLHLGHAFSLSKLEFASAYHRLCGKKVLFPQGFHCTGMPIKACADKLDHELSTYGCPPRFPEEDDGAAEAEAAQTAAAEKDPAKFSGKKSKAAAKKGTGSTQWDILIRSGIPEAEVPNCRDPMHWLRYFPPMARRDITAMGCGVDWRRAFITTDVNPFYDGFIQWQFRTLRKQGKIVKDKRYAVYSPKDGQPCADHDRATGEGVGPQEYTLIKMRALALPGRLAELEGAGPVFLLAATLRPETMYGQTNAWALPEGDYGAFRAPGGEVYIMMARAARNLSWQDRLPPTGAPERLLALKGQDLIGVPLQAPNCPHERIYVLPLLTILTSKGTGVVTSVPSDAPDDWAALIDLRRKEKLREKFGVRDEWVLPYEVIPIIHIPGFGDKAAEKACLDLKVQSQNDSKKLAEAKQQVYLKGFTDGVMLAGPHKGEKVSEAKPVIRAELVEAGQAILYSEPERAVTSRSGDDCVVALTDQWYITYGEADWEAATTRCLAAMETYGEEGRRAFEHTLGWLRQWACSRSFGLGTRLPWDPQYLIESLSDSTIYMAFYTVAHLLLNGDMYGETPGAVAPADVTDAVWDHVLLGAPAPRDCALPAGLLARMRREFQFWYPFDLRVSGKDLINNHLTFALYNHTAIWANEPRLWPRSMRTNGHLLLNAEKMSKSTGNFKTLEQAVADYSADATRVALADAGDTMDDANFEMTTANSAILRLTKELAWTEEVLRAMNSLRVGPHGFHDRVFDNEMNVAVAATRQAYEGLMFREALKAGWYDLLLARDAYRVAAGERRLHRDLVARFLEVSTLLLAPICPHTCEHVWRTLLRRPGSALTAGWPAADEPDYGLRRAADYLDTLVTTVRSERAKAEAPPKRRKGDTGPVTLPPKVTRAGIYVAARYGGWQEAALGYLASRFDAGGGCFPPDTLGSVLEAVRASGTTGNMPDKALKQTVLPFVRAKMDEAVKGGAQLLATKLPFSEAELISDNCGYLLRVLALEALEVCEASEAAAAAAGRPHIAAAQPGSPVVHFAAPAEANGAS